MIPDIVCVHLLLGGVDLGVAVDDDVSGGLFRENFGIDVVNTEDGSLCSPGLPQSERLHNTENTPCRKAAREMDENMLYWKRGARSRDGLLL